MNLRILLNSLRREASQPKQVAFYQGRALGVAPVHLDKIGYLEIFSANGHTVGCGQLFATSGFCFAIQLNFS